MGKLFYYGLHKHNKAFISNYYLICPLWIDCIALLACRALVNMGFDFLLVKDTSQSEKNVMRPVSSLSAGRRENTVQRQKNTKIVGAQIVPNVSQLGFQNRPNLSLKFFVHLWNTEEGYVLQWLLIKWSITCHPWRVDRLYVMIR